MSSLKLQKKFQKIGIKNRWQNLFRNFLSEFLTN